MGPWIDVPYRRQYGGSSKQQQPWTTFYVTNLPGGVSKSLLWKAFQPHGVVKDAYVAKKRDSRGNYFGFVRYEGVYDVEKVLQGMNTVKIYEAKLCVSLAKYDKDHKKFAHPPVKNIANVNVRQPYPQPARIYVPVSKERSFADTVVGASGSKENKRKIIEADDEMALYADHCMMRSVLVEAKSVNHMSMVRSMLNAEGYEDSSVCYVGGLMCMLKIAKLVYLKKKNP